MSIESQNEILGQLEGQVLDEFNETSRVVNSQEEFTIRVLLTLKNEVKSKDNISKIKASFYIEKFDDVVEKVFLDEVPWEKGCDKYELKAIVKKGTLQSGVYKVIVTLILMGENNHPTPLLGFIELPVIQVYENY